MNTETQKVDVLALLEALATQTKQRGGSPSVENIETAREAVAELIEASNKVADRCWTHMGNDSLYEMQDLRKVLARFGGAA